MRGRCAWLVPRWEFALSAAPFVAYRSASAQELVTHVLALPDVPPGRPALAP